jgi:alpha-galactosidase
MKIVSGVFSASSIAILFLLSLAAAHAQDTVWLDTLDLSKMRQGYGTPQTNRAIRETPLTLAGRKFERGVGTHAHSSFWVQLNGGTERFSATIGVDDAAAGPGSVIFRVLADGKRVFDSGVMKTGQPPKTVSVDLRGAKVLLLQVTDAGDGNAFDHADWADAKFLVTGARPEPVVAPVEPAEILTPVPGLAPRINGPKVYGCRSGNPFLYRLPAQGERPMTFLARSLPAGLKLDAKSGIITGVSPVPGEHVVTVRAKNRHGKAHRSFRIISGDTLALTPPMGWNHWYAHYDRITDAMMRQAADIMITSGMADVGYQYVNIDDCWMNAPKHKDPMRVGPARDETGRILPNKYFPDMKGLADYIHARGLKAGLYTSPGTLTCGGFTGAYQHEAQDARTFAEWGFDFLKYDWCSYGHIAEGGDPKATNIPTWGKGAPNLEGYIYPYRLMGGILKQQRRDIVLNLCQYGMGNVWEWGAAIGGHCWRTAGDLGFELDRIFEVALKNSEHRAWSWPGSWNDPDYIQIGWIGNARGGGMPEPCPLTPNEQYAYMSLWALMASPLFYSGDMTKLDAFTLNVLCNPEVIDIDQDPLGQSAAVSKVDDENAFIMVKDLEGGSKAVGLFNRGEFPAEISLRWSVAGVKGPQIVRDVWRQKNIGRLTQYRANVPRHGCMLLTLRSPEDD